MWRGTSGH
uniref:Uncharacterized protein n=1 Tax=Arundo donax TaxID=35708 RepID=A0A0A9CEL7_ARUDO